MRRECLLYIKRKISPFTKWKRRGRYDAKDFSYRSRLSTIRCQGYVRTVPIISFNVSNRNWITRCIDDSTTDGYISNRTTTESFLITHFAWGLRGYRRARRTASPPIRPFQLDCVSSPSISTPHCFALSVSRLSPPTVEFRKVPLRTNTIRTNSVCKPMETIDRKLCTAFETDSSRRTLVSEYGAQFTTGFNQRVPLMERWNFHSWNSTPIERFV